MFPQLMLMLLCAFISGRAQFVKGWAEMSNVKRKMYLEVRMRREGAWKLPASKETGSAFSVFGFL